MSVIGISVLYGVVAAIGWGVADFVAAAASKRIGVLRTATGVHISSSVAVAGYFIIVFEPGLLSWAHWATLVGVSVLAVLVYLCFYRALREGPVAVVSPIVSLLRDCGDCTCDGVLGRALSGWQALGAMCSIGGVALASFDPRRRLSGGRIIGLGVGLAVVTMLSIGLLSYVIGLLSRELGWFLPVYISRTMTLGLFIPLSVALRQWTLRGLTIPLALGVAVAGIVEMGGMFAYARGTEIGVISIVAAASIAYPLIPMLGGIVVFGERLAWSQWMGLGIALSGLFVLAIAS